MPPGQFMSFNSTFNKRWYSDTEPSYYEYLKCAEYRFCRQNTLFFQLVIRNLTEGEYKSLEE